MRVVAAVALLSLSLLSEALVQTPSDTASFARLGLPATRVVSAERVEAGARAGAHCLLRGAVNERTGTDGKPYAIGFEMRLPVDWNGRYWRGHAPCAIGRRWSVTAATAISSRPRASSASKPAGPQARRRAVGF